MSYLSNILNNCSEVSKLALKEDASPLSFRKKMEMKLHVALCKCCQNFVKQSAIIDKAIKTYTSSIQDNPNYKASEAFKNKLKDTFKDQ